MPVRTMNDSLLDELRQGGGPANPQNPYLILARDLHDTLYSIDYIREQQDKLFCRENPLVVEIGTYMGHTLIEMGRFNPDVNFIGIDIKFKRVVKAAKKIERLKLNNVKMSIGDGKQLLRAFRDSSLGGVCVFFSDPWEKKQKNRLLSEAFFQTTYRKLKRGGFLWIKTDHEAYFRTNLAFGRTSGFTRITERPALIEDRPYPTFFETLFENQDKELFEAVLVKQENGKVVGTAM